MVSKTGVWFRYLADLERPSIRGAFNTLAIEPRWNRTREQDTRTQTILSNGRGCLNAIKAVLEIASLEKLFIFDNQDSRGYPSVRKRLLNSSLPQLRLSTRVTRENANPQVQGLERVKIPLVIPLVESDHRNWDEFPLDLLFVYQSYIDCSSS